MGKVASKFITLFFLASLIVIGFAKVALADSKDHILGQQKLASIGSLSQEGLPSNVEWSDFSSIPTLLRVKKMQLSGNTLEEKSQNFFQSNNDLFKVNDPRQTLVLESKKKDRHGRTHLKWNQLYGGIEVYGGEVILHFDQDDSFRGFNGYYLSDINVNTSPGLTSEEAVGAAKHGLYNFAGITDEVDVQTDNPQLLIYHTGFSNRQKGEFSLVWRVKLYSKNSLLNYLFFIDAHTREIHKVVNLSSDAKYRTVSEPAYCTSGVLVASTPFFRHSF
jgi:bacillolysin/thermolysin